MVRHLTPRLAPEALDREERKGPRQPGRIYSPRSDETRFDFRPRNESQQPRKDGTAEAKDLSRGIIEDGD
jgi:hypothetical protein